MAHYLPISNLRKITEIVLEYFKHHIKTHKIQPDLFMHYLNNSFSNVVNKLLMSMWRFIKYAAKCTRACKGHGYHIVTIKRLAPCRCWDGYVKEPYEMSMALGARSFKMHVVAQIVISICCLLYM